MTFFDRFLCIYCKRFDGTQFIDGADTVTCDAYPDGIPREIITNKVDHRSPYRGDGGLTFVALRNRQHSIDKIDWQT